MAVRYLAVPGQFVYITGACSRSSLPIVFVCGAQFMNDENAYRWTCHEIVPESTLVSEFETGKRPIGQTVSEDVPNFIGGHGMRCTGCGITTHLYFRCGACKTVNCWGSVSQRRKAWPRLWEKETISRCGHCGNEKPLDEVPEMLLSGFRDTSPSARSTSTALQMKKDLK